jgi:peptide/nickel transport system substrate-binding protein
MLFPFLPKHIYEKTWKDDPKLTQSEVHRKLELKPVVGGPYEIESRKYNEEIVLKRRENYYMYKGKQVRDIPYFKHVRFRIVRDPNTALLALNRGDIEEMELTMQQWKNQTNGDDFYASNTKSRNSEWLYFYFGWNGVKQPIFADKNVRVAMSYAFNHQEMLDKLNYGLTQPSLGPMHPESWQFPKEAGLKPYKHDVDKALDILENAGWEDTDGDGILDKVINGKKTQFEFTLNVLNDPPRIEICALLKNTLDKMGIKCMVQPLELTTMSKKMIEKDFDAAFSGWGTGANPDTASNIWTTKAIADGRNYVSYSNKQVDGLFELGKQVPTAKEERERIVKAYELGKVGIGADADLAKIYGKINEIIYLDQPYTFLYYRSAFYGFNKSLRGYHFSPRGPYHFGPGISSIWKAMQ